MEIKLSGKSMFYGAGPNTIEAATLLRKNMTPTEQRNSKNLVLKSSDFQMMKWGGGVSKKSKN